MQQPAAWMGYLVWGCALALCGLPVGHAQIDAPQAFVFVDFQHSLRNQGTVGGTLNVTGAQLTDHGALEFTSPGQYAELDEIGCRALSAALADVRELTIGGWFQLRRTGEQLLMSRGEMEIGALGERFFRVQPDYIDFCLGTDQHGFLLGTIHGNGGMPFPHVTINDIPIFTWQQLVVVKDSAGFHRFYQNGVLIHSDRHAMAAPSRMEWNETARHPPPLRFAVPEGGMIGEAWVIGRAIADDEVVADYEHKRKRYRPAPPGQAMSVRDMFEHPPIQTPVDLMKARAEFLKLLGEFPSERCALAPQCLGDEDCGHYIRRKVSLQVQPGDRMPAYLLIPKQRGAQVPAIICFYGTTGGAGKATTVGMSGRRLDEPPHPNLSFAIDMVEAGFVAFAADYLRDGERIHPGDVPYDTTRFYQQFPEWSIHGKDAWDTMRAIDYLETLDFVDRQRIGMVGHSYGGHSTIFTTAVEPRIRAAFANGPVSAFREHGMHWAVPAGARNSQSLPALRPYLLDPDLPLPVSFAEVTALVAPRPLMIGQAVGERRPIEEQNCAVVRRAYGQLDAANRVRYVWYAGDHDFPPAVRRLAVDWFRQWLLPDSGHEN